MRRLEYIGGGSAKFWEGAVQGTDVLVSWGRIGTVGQSKRKEFRTADAAAAALAKQVADKLNKGYADVGTPPGAAAPAGAPPTPVAAERPVTAARPAEPVAPPAAAEPDGVPVTVPDTVPVTVTVTVTEPDTVTMPDEDTFDPAPGLVRLAYPRRDQGRTRTRPVQVPAEDVDRMLATNGKAFAHLTDSAETDPAIAAAVRRHLDGTPDPLGAATMALAVRVNAGFQRKQKFPFAAHWLSAHGLMFAVEATMRLGTITIHHRAGGRVDMRHTRPGDRLFYRWPGGEVAGEVRAALAASTDAEYAEAVATIGRFRLDTTTRLMASFLAPTESAWVAELDADVDSGDHHTRWMYLAAVSDAEQLARFSPGALTIARHSRLLPTIVRTVGPAAAPTLAQWARSAETDARGRLLTAVVAMPTDDAFSALLAHAANGAYLAALREAMTRYPVRATRLLAEAAAAGSEMAATLLRGHLLAWPNLLTDVVPGLPDAARQAALATQTGVVRLPDAPADSLPPVLVDRPWARARTTTPRVELTGLDVAAPTQVRWADQERERALAQQGRTFNRRHRAPDIDWAAELEAVRRNDHLMPSLLLHAPAELAADTLAGWRPSYTYGLEAWGAPLLARFDAAAVPAVRAVVAGNPTPDHLAVLLPVLDTAVAVIMSTALAKRRAARPVVESWLTRHRLATVPYLVSAVVGPKGAARTNAENVLRLLAKAEGADAVAAEAARVAGGPAGDEVARVLATDPLELVPHKLPVPGEWAEPAFLPQVRLRDREVALPRAATADLVLMLAFSNTAASHYGGIDQVAEVCDRTSLAEFGWGLFEAWRKAGMPAKDGWALTALAAVGDDETVRRLAPVIRVWPGEGGHARAVTGLDVLAEIGTDVALMHLNGIAQKVKFSGLRQRAREKIELVAAKLGLTAEQLADRLVPDLGLAGDGTMVLDYGPRRFVVGFDEALRPTVSDEDGTRRKSLPKPGAKDDQQVATAAYQRFTALKKDVRTLAGDQILRLERAMVSGRRWSQADFAAYFSGHPLLWHLVRRLVWGVYDGENTLVGAFRLAEDRTLADAEDEIYTPPEGATVGVAHPLHLGDTLTGWAEVFADYEILQPFPQLGRPVLALTDEERAASTLARVAGSTVSVTRVLGLAKRGWERTPPQDGGVELGLIKPLAGGWFAALELSEGIVAGDPTMLGENQKITRVFLSPRRDGWWLQALSPLGAVDPVSASELLVDLTELVNAP